MAIAGWMRRHMIDRYTVVTELGPVRVAAGVGDVEHPGLVPAEPVAVGDLEQDRVPERRQPALAAPVAGSGDLLICVVEELLQLVDGNARFSGRPSLSWTCTALFQSCTIWIGCVPNRCSHAAGQS